MVSKSQTETLPFFSIIIPSYNVNPEYFSECVACLKKQTCPDFEVILIDDGSKEQFKNQYDEAAKNDSRIRVIHKENQGVSAARNDGIQLARAERIIFLDADDWLSDNAIQILKETSLNNDYDILLFNYERVYDDGRHIKLPTGFVSDRLYLTVDPVFRELLYRRAMGTPNIDGQHLSTIYYSWDKIYRRQFLIDNNLKYPVGLPKSEDKVFILECFRKLNKFFYLDADLYHYRINSESASNKYSPNVDHERALLNVYLERLASEMDAELGEAFNIPNYSRIRKEYNRFVFGIISDLLFSKYYHPEYPAKGWQREKEVRLFLNTDPFKTAIHSCSYADLDTPAKLKKFILSHGMTTLFCHLRRRRKT